MPPRRKKKINPNAPEQGNEAVYYKSFEDLNRRTRRKLVKDQQTENQGGLLKTRRGKTVIYQSKTPENKSLALGEKDMNVQPELTFNRGQLNSMGQDMALSSAFRDVYGNDHTNKSNWESANKRALNEITASGRAELRNPTQLINTSTNRALTNFSGSDQLIGSMAGDWEGDTLTPGDISEGATRVNKPTDATIGSPTNPNRGNRASTVIDIRTGGAIKTGVTNRDLQSESGVMTNATQMGNTTNGQGRVYNFVEGASGFQDRDVMLAATNPKKYTPITAGTSSTRDYDLSSNDGGRMLTPSVTGGLDASKFRGIGSGNQPNITGVTKIAPEFKYNSVSGDDNYSKLQVERTTSPIKIHKSANKLKGVFINSKIKRGKRPESKKNKVQKVKGAVDLDMDGVIGNTRLERNAKAFAGVDNIYSTRGAARREIRRNDNKRVGRTPEKQLLKMKQDEGKALHKKDFNYLVDGEDKGAALFKSAQKHNVRKFNENQAQFNTQHMNQGVGLSNLSGADGYTARFNVNKDDAFGTGAITGTHNTNKNIDQKKYQKLQKRLDSKVLGRFYKK